MLAYDEDDLPVQRQASLPLLVFNTIYNDTSSELSTAIGELIYGAMFFAMRSCEYSKTQERNPKSKILTVGDVQFYNKTGHRVNKNLHQAHAVKITFRNQKNGEKMESITRYRSKSKYGSDPISIWAQIISRINKIDGTTDTTPVNIVCINKKLHYITASQLRTCIKSTVKQIGFKILGIHPHEVGTHSIRTFFATFLAAMNVDVKYIMIQGRWKSDCVLRYIRKDIVDNNISRHILNCTNVLRRKLA